jgi:hypothetical protein
MRHKDWRIFFFAMLFFIQSGVIPLAAQRRGRAGGVDGNGRQKFEIGVHYSLWSIDQIKSFFEDSLTKRIGREIGEEVTALINDSHTGLIRSAYQQNLLFDSGGSNFGLEIRYYPKGEFGSFSFGLSLEKTNITLRVDGPVKQEFSNGTYADVEAQSFIELNPVSTNLSFRWDMKPDWIVSPYFVLGFGLGVLNGTVGYEYQGVYKWSGPEQTIRDEQIKTIKETEEEIDYNLPNIFPLLQANLGLRADVFPFMSLRAEVGFWDGLVIRAGISFYFFRQ